MSGQLSLAVVFLGTQSTPHGKCAQKNGTDILHIATARLWCKSSSLLVLAFVVHRISSSMNGGEYDACPMHSSEFRKDSRAQHRRLRGMPRHGRQLGASSPVPAVRACGLLRRLEEQARLQAFQEDRASDHDFARAGGELELVLRRRDRHGA